VTATPANLEDLPGCYAAYLERLAREVGEIKVGAFAKYAGRLIKKLSFEEFTPVYVEHTELLARYHDSLERGDTVNDLVLRLLREQAATLVLPAPKL
jgi:hypothetical protein